jgi:hypothetical protein
MIVGKLEEVHCAITDLQALSQKKTMKHCFTDSCHWTIDHWN